MSKDNRLRILAWTVGILGGLFFWALRATNRIKLEGLDRTTFHPKKDGLILVHNHPSLWEPLMFPFIFFPWYLFSLRYVALSTPDKENYYDKWWFFLIRPVCVAIKRGSPREEMKALKDLRTRLSQGHILALAPEGGRTFKGEQFKIIQNGTIITLEDSSQIDPIKYTTVRTFKPGVRWLITNSKAQVIPIWTEGGDRVFPNHYSFRFYFPRLWRQTIIRIGEPLDLTGVPKDKITEVLEESVLRLGERSRS